MPVVTQDYAPPRQEPEPPSPDFEPAADDGKLQVAMDAGTGSSLAYAEASVVELGGVMAFTHASETTTFRIAPSLGYFVVDNLELTLFPDLTLIHVDGEDDEDGETDVTFGALLEPSYHLPLGKKIFVFAGIGLGLRYAEDPGVDFALRPRIGMDFLVGRSGILKPALFMDIGANDGLSQGGFEVGFTVML